MFVKCETLMKTFQFPGIEAMKAITDSNPHEEGPISMKAMKLCTLHKKST